MAGFAAGALPRSDVSRSAVSIRGFVSRLARSPPRRPSCAAEKGPDEEAPSVRRRSSSRRLVAFAAPASAADTVTISGRAYAFNHMSTYLEGRHDQGRGRSRADRDHRCQRRLHPRGPGRHQRHALHRAARRLQRDRPADVPPPRRGHRERELPDPGDAEYAGLSAILSVPIDEATGRPEQCVIVTTASARNVRGVDYETFHANTPHGVPGATSEEFPALDGPIYFNEFVIPDPSKTETSEDGGIVWTDVPAGAYRIATASATTASPASWRPARTGRIVNANPPWGAYELSPGEQPLGRGSSRPRPPRVGRRRRTPGSQGDRDPRAAARPSHVNAVLRKGASGSGTCRHRQRPPGQRTVKVPSGPMPARARRR